MSSTDHHTRLLLDNIRSVHNVGSIFRTADTLGISHIYCVGTTPVPIDRFDRKRKDFTKVSLGAEDSVAWEHMGNQEALALIGKLRKDGYQVVALEQAHNSLDYKEVSNIIHRSGAKSKLISGSALKLQSQQRLVVILGSEVDGVSPGLLRSADIIAEIPMKGKKESLNVSVAAAVFLYRLLDK